MLEIIRHMVADGPKTVGPFHHAVTAGDFHFITGQMPTVPDDPTRLVEGGVEAQTRRVMDNLGLVLTGLGSGFDDGAGYEDLKCLDDDFTIALNDNLSSTTTPSCLSCSASISSCHTLGMTTRSTSLSC